MRRLWLMIPVGVVALMVTSSALASSSSVLLWSALGNNVTCGIAIHATRAPPSRVLCSSRHVPAPRGPRNVGDPGFVFLGAHGRPVLARLSQDSFVGTHVVALRAGTTWHRAPVGVTCTISATTVRCTNRARHGFTITRHAYHAF